MQFWYRSPSWQAFLLSPLSALYRGVVALRRAMYRLKLAKMTRLSVPVIVVGNIMVGGTGKSPMVAWLVNYLQGLGYRPGIVSRGYGGSLIKRPTLLTEAHSADQVGDEALMLFHQTQVPVAVCASRVEACHTLLAKTDCNVIVSDDGLQHYAMVRDIEVIMFDAQRLMGNGFCLPAGPLREPKRRCQQTPWLVYTGGDQQHYTLQLKPSRLYALNDHQQTLALEALQSKTVHAVAGIGHPQRFFNTLRVLGVNVIEHAFADHHVFSSSDLQFDDEHWVVMTAKDAIKCRDLGLKNAYVLAVEAELNAAFVADFGQALNSFPLLFGVKHFR